MPDNDGWLARHTLPSNSLLTAGKMFKRDRVTVRINSIADGWTLGWITNHRPKQRLHLSLGEQHFRHLNSKFRNKHTLSKVRGLADSASAELTICSPVWFHL